MICEDLPAAVAAKAVSCLIENIQTGIETGANLGNWTGTGIMIERGTGKETEPETEIRIETGLWTETETETKTGTGTETETETETKIKTGTEIGSGKGTETGGMIMIADPSIQKEKAEGTMTEALVMAVGTTEKLVPVEVGVGAEAEVRACKLAMTTLIIVQVHSQMGAKRRPLHLPIWRSSEICMVTQVIKKGAVPWKEAVVGTIAVKR